MKYIFYIKNLFRKQIHNYETFRITVREKGYSILDN